MKRLALLATTLATLAAVPSHATLVTDTSAFVSPTVADFSGFVGLGHNFTFGPEAVGSVGFPITFTATPGGGGNSGNGSVLGQGGYGLGGNGTWQNGPGGNAYSGLDSMTGYMQYAFSAPVAAAGGFINYLPGAEEVPFIEVLGLDLTTILETWDLSVLAPISTPGGLDAGAFRGIVRPTADIGALRVYNAYIVLDDLTYSTEAVPEPGTMLLLGSGIAGLALRRRRKA